VKGEHKADVLHNGEKSCRDSTTKRAIEKRKTRKSNRERSEGFSKKHKKLKKFKRKRENFLHT